MCTDNWNGSGAGREGSRRDSKRGDWLASSYSWKGVKKCVLVHDLNYLYRGTLTLNPTYKFDTQQEDTSHKLCWKNFTVFLEYFKF